MSIEKDITYLKNVLGEIRLANEFKKYLISIRDLNSFLSLDELLWCSDHVTTLNLRDLSSDCFGMGYFINRQKDSLDLTYYKALIIIYKFDEMSDGCLEQFEEDYGVSFIQNLKKVKVSPPDMSKITEREKQIAEKWWSRKY